MESATSAFGSPAKPATYGTRAPHRPGPPLYAFLIVLVIVVIAAVAIQASRQRRGLAWASIGATPRGALPRCVWPGDALRVSGRISAFPGFPGFVEPCYTATLPASASAAQVAAMGIAADASTACPDADLWFQGRGRYACAAPLGAAGGPRMEGCCGSTKPTLIAAAATAAAAAAAEGFSSPAWPRPIEFAGASRELKALLRRAICHPGHVPVLLAGTIDAYRGPTDATPCGTLRIDRPTPATLMGLKQLEEAASASCPQRAGWYVVRASGVCPDVFASCGAAVRESFYWTDWDTSTERENYVGHLDSGREGSGQRRRRRERFSPDDPLACGRNDHSSLRTAARHENAALLVAAGH